jgi:anti-sigma factor RsiW
MSCEAWEALLIALLDGELEAGERARLESHLAGCAHCREDLAELRAASAALRRWEAEEPPSDPVFVRRERRGPAAGGGAAWRRLGWLVPAGLGAALAAAAVAIVMSNRPPADPRVGDLAAQLSRLEARLAAAETAASAPARASGVTPVEVAGAPSEPAGGPRPVADLPPEARAWLAERVDQLVRQSESRQDTKLLLTADQLARSLAVQRREDLQAFDRLVRDVRAETFDALLSTHERLDRIAPATPARGEEPGRLEPR